MMGERGEPVSPEKVASVIQFYVVDKKPARSIADELNLAENTVYKILRRYDVPIRTQGDYRDIRNAKEYQAVRSILKSQSGG